MKKTIAQALGRLSSPLIQRLGGTPLLYAMETYLAFLAGKGSGSGWDIRGETRAVSEQVRSEAPIIVDVGANIGIWSLTLSEALQKPEARFYMVEPVEYCFPDLLRRLPMIPNPTHIKLAVSDHSGKATMHVPTKGSGLASMYKREDISVVKQDYVPVEFETITIDDLMERHGIDSVDVLKMDIEGHELAALSGASSTLKRTSVVQFEFGSSNVNSRTFFKDYWDVLTEAGFHLHRILPGGSVTPVKKYTEGLEYFRGATNYIATKET